MQKRKRPQKGSIRKKGGWWILRYRQKAFVDGELLTIYRSKHLAPIHNPKLRKPPEHVIDAAKAILEPINQGKMPPQSPQLQEISSSTCTCRTAKGRNAPRRSVITGINGSSICSSAAATGGCARYGRTS